ncbi:hypothetical protein FH972_022320 [Carpinus fangiana]|uniref:Nudix hydrolase domain-containing protein n=1 Tax=Carpinus fangiana TaxID=176857 RepID=A0A5N6KS98_9ROSI|nr:hypothetical protein FH972_022320 [Carpinus fangiana]
MSETVSPGAGQAPKSNLDLINECDSFPYFTRSPERYTQQVQSYYHLLLPNSEATFGYILPSVAALFANLPAWELDDAARTLTLTGGHDEPTRSALVAQTCAAMRATGHFAVLGGWRDELYPVYDDAGTCVFTVERSASPLFGVLTYGVHLTAYVPARSPTDSPRLWVPRRAAHKQTYGGMLDNTVAGGIAAGESPWTTLLREATEEASLPAQLLRERARAAGTVSYFSVRDERAGGETGLLQPECQFVYDLPVEESTELAPGDQEVEGFELLSVAAVKDALAKGEFKPNCALVLLDFFIRHGILTPEGERDYPEIVARLHRILEFPCAVPARIDGIILDEEDS